MPFDPGNDCPNGSLATGGYWRAMSQENVEVVRARLQPSRRGWLPGVRPRQFQGGHRAIHHGAGLSDIDWLSLISASTQGRGYRGHDGLRQWGRDMEDTWEYFRIEAMELTDAGDRVVASVHLHGRGRVSGAAVDLYVAHVWTFRNGRVVRMEVHDDVAEALKAVGLSE